MEKKRIFRALAAVAFATIMAIPHAAAYIEHVVKKGETLYGVAHTYGVSPDDLTKANPHAATGLKKGMLLRIPEKGDLSDLSDVDSPAESVKMDSEGTFNTPVTGQKRQSTETPVTDQGKQSTETSAPDDSSAEQQPQLGVVATAAYNEPPYSPGATQQPDIYIAKFGDTLHSVAMKTGVSESKLLTYNPLIDVKHIPEGYKVRLSEDAPYLSHSASMTLVDSIIYKVTPTETVDIAAVGTPSDETSALTVAVMLPFDADSETVSRQSLLVTDFYKGLLMAAKDVLDNGKFPLKIIAVDTQCDEGSFDSQLDDLMLRGVSVIIPPEDETQLDKIETAALSRGITVINALSVRDEGYMKYPNVLQCNISQKLMYDKAINTLMTDLEDFTPVILDLSGAKDEKLSFIDQLRSRYTEAGRNVIDLSFKNMLTAEDISSLPAGTKYVFIPKSGSPEVFFKIYEALTTAINENYADDKYRVFGYPDWITFKGDHEEALHNMGATIYSRFYLDPYDPQTEEVNKDFVNWYGYQMEEVYPSQGMLGYDIGHMIFSKLKGVDNTDIQKALGHGTYSGRQSSFRFSEPSDAQTSTPGMINDILYIIEYLPGTLTNSKAI